MTILVATGLKREARIMQRPGVTVVAGGGDGARLEAELKRLAPGASAILSSGLAGALDPGLRVGDVVIGSECHSRESGNPSTFQGSRGGAEARREDKVDPRFRGDDGLEVYIGARLPNARTGLIAGSDTPLLTPAAKAELHASTGALAVDMESHIAARVAARHGLPFAFVRVISDAARDALPPAVLAGMKPGGGVDPLGVLAALFRDPGQVPALIRTARDAGRALRVLRRCHKALNFTPLSGRA